MSQSSAAAHQNLSAADFVYPSRTAASLEGRWKSIHAVLTTEFKSNSNNDTAAVPFSVIDLGAGTGYTSLQIAKNFPKSQVVAVEGAVGVGSYRTTKGSAGPGVNLKASGTKGNYPKSKGLKKDDGDVEMDEEEDSVESELTTIYSSTGVTTLVKNLKQLNIQNCHVAPEIWSHKDLRKKAYNGVKADCVLALSVIHDIELAARHEFGSGKEEVASSLNSPHSFYGANHDLCVDILVNLFKVSTKMCIVEMPPEQDFYSHDGANWGEVYSRYENGVVGLLTKAARKVYNAVEESDEEYDSETSDEDDLCRENAVNHNTDSFSIELVHTDNYDRCDGRKTFIVKGYVTAIFRKCFGTLIGGSIICGNEEKKLVIKKALLDQHGNGKYPRYWLAKLDKDFGKQGWRYIQLTESSKEFKALNYIACYGGSSRNPNRKLRAAFRLENKALWETYDGSRKAHIAPNASAVPVHTLRNRDAYKELSTILKLSTKCNEQILTHGHKKNALGGIGANGLMKQYSTGQKTWFSDDFSVNVGYTSNDMNGTYVTGLNADSLLRLKNSSSVSESPLRKRTRLDLSTTGAVANNKYLVECFQNSYIRYVFVCRVLMQNVLNQSGYLTLANDSQIYPEYLLAFSE